MAGVGAIEGLVSGLNTTELIDKIMALDRRPITKLEARINSIKQIRSAYDALEANILALKVDAQKMYRRDRLVSYLATSSDEDIVTASAGSLVREGSYTMTVSRLAQNHQITSKVFADADQTSVGTGTISIAVGDAPAVTITVDASNNTLDSLADAINNADAGVRASVVNVGGGSSSYRLLISAGKTGAANRITMDENLTGGAGLGIGEVGDAVYGTWNGTSQVATGGTYTGDASATFQFTVTAGGTVGTDAITLSYTDGGSISGTITVPSGTPEGTEFEVFGGLKISLGAGTVVAGETFSVEATPTTVQAPVNALITLGSSEGGASPIEVESASNTVTDLITGLTLDLHRADASTPVTLGVTVDAEGIMQKLDDFITHFNTLITFFNGNFKYNQETEQAGTLLGDSYAMRLNQSIRSQVTDFVRGINQDLTSLAALGIRSGSDGTLTMNRTEVESALKTDIDDIARLFSNMGVSTDADVQFLFASSKTKATYLVSEQGYAVNITTAASKASLAAASITAPSAGSPLVVDDGNHTLRIMVNDRTSTEIAIENGSYASGDAIAAALEEAINADPALELGQIDVAWIDDGGGTGHLAFSSREFGASSKLRFETVAANAIYGDLGIATGELAVGTNVAGTINGEAATGSGRYLTGASGNATTDGLQLLVSITPEQLASQGGSQGYVSVTKGIGARLSEFIDDITDIEHGALTKRQESFVNNAESLQDQIDMIEARLAKKRARIEKQYAELETLLSNLQSEESYLTSLITDLQSVRFSNSKK